MRARNDKVWLHCKIHLLKCKSPQHEMEFDKHNYTQNTLMKYCSSSETLKDSSDFDRFIESTEQVLTSSSHFLLLLRKSYMYIL